MNPLPPTWAGFVRQSDLGVMLFSACSYEPVRDFFHAGRGRQRDANGATSAPSPLYVKVLAGLTTGFIGVMVSNPTDVVKVRLQSQGFLPPGATRQYAGSLDAYRKILALDGISP